MGNEACPLCSTPAATYTFDVLDRSFHRCGTCRLLFVPPDGRPDRAAEESHYLQHHNDPTDDAYRNFLDRLLIPLQATLAPGAEGLDFGSGPGPTASIMLAERGFPTALYDPFFAPDTMVLDRTYDFIACSETVEHFHRPAETFEQLDRLLDSSGTLGIMTEMVDDRLSGDWWYLRDPTHVCFYATETMAWIAHRFAWTMQSPDRNVVLFKNA